MIRLLDVEKESADVAIIPGINAPLIDGGLTPEGGCSTCAAHRPGPQPDGNLHVDPEISLPSPGMDVEIGFNLSSASDYNSFLGYGWTQTPNMLAQASGNPTIATFTRGDGARVAYEDDGLGNFTAMTPRCLNSLEKDDANSLWKESTPQGQTTAYPLDTDGNVTTVSWVQDSVGNYHTYAYSSGLLSTLEDAVGREVSFSYDEDDLLQSIEDWAGRRTTFAYDTATFEGKPVLTTVTGPSGCNTRYHYEAGEYPNTSIPLLIGITNPNGYGTSYSYDSDRRVTTREIVGVGITTYAYTGDLNEFQEVTDAEGNITTYSLGNGWKINGTIDPVGDSTSTSYNAKQQPTSRTDGLGNIWTTAYDDNHNPIAQENPLGYRTTTIYDSYHNPTSITYADGGIVTMVWGYAGSSFDTTGEKRRLQAQVNQLGYRTTHTYNGRGQMAATQDAMGYVTTYHLDSLGNQECVEDPLGYRTTSTFDLAGNVICRQDALGYCWSQTFDARNRRLVSEDPLGNRTTVAYDSVGNRTVRIDPLGYRTSWTYNVWDKQVCEENALAYRTTTEYDGLGQNTATESALGYRTSLIYDAAGRVIAVQDALGFRHTIVFDAAGRAEAAVDPLGYRTTTVHDGAGQQLATVNALGHRTSTVFDVVERAEATQNALGYFTSFVHDLAGQRVAVVDANGHRNTSVFDARGSLVATQDPLGAYTSYQYGPTQAPTQRIDARNWVTTYTADALGRTTGALYRDDSRVPHTFDAAGRETVMADPSGETMYGHDATGRVSGVAYPTGLALTYAFDPLGQRVSLLDPDAGRTTYTWDGQGRLTGILNPFNEQTTITHDPLDRELHKTLANGITVSQTYDSAGRETVLENRKSDGEALAVYTATYDATRNRLTVLELHSTRVTYSYDSSSQLIGEQRSGANAYDTSYQYDPVGNRLVKDDSSQLTTCSYNAADGLTLVQPPTGQPTTMSCDANGNLLVEMAGGELTTYTWDSEDRLAGIAHPSSTLDTYTYAANGLRQKRETGAVATIFVWDGQNVLMETDRDLIGQAQYTDFPGYWGGLTSQRRGEVSDLYGFDMQGSARILVSAAEQITDTYDFKAFGEELGSTGSTVNALRYVGQFGYYRDTSERLYVRARHLGVSLARWLSMDPALRLARLDPWVQAMCPTPTSLASGSAACARPAGRAHGPSAHVVPYGYCASRPVTLVDPSGLLQVPPWLRDGADCICAIAGIADLIPLFGAHPCVEGLDCACQALSLWEEHSHLTFWQLVGAGGLSLLDCVSILIDLATAGIGGTVADWVAYVLQNEIYFGYALNAGGYAACKRTWQNLQNLK